MTPVHPDLVAAIASRLTAQGQRLAVAESCTGGLIAEWLTDRAGSSAWFDCGLVTYSNAAKHTLLGVPQDTLDQHGAVSGPVVLAMTQGLLARAPVDWTLAVSGIAGPDGGSAQKPVGTVWIGWAGRVAAPGCSRFLFRGDRSEVRRQSAMAALHGLLNLLESQASPAVV